jgi:hypothetical protein
VSLGGSTELTVPQGDGSELNADAVDGKHADAFADAGHDHNHDELTNVGSSDHHSRYTDSEAIEAVNGETSLGDANSVNGQTYSDIQNWVNNNADVPNANQADNANTLDGYHASAFADAGHDHNHDELTNVGSSDHHSRYTDSEAVATVNGERSLTVDITGNAGALDGKHADDFADASHNHDGSYINGYQSNNQNDMDSIALANCWETIEVNSGDFTIVDNNTIEVNEAGVYSVDYTCSFEQWGDGLQATMHANVLINGTGNSDHTGSHCYVRDTASGDINSFSNHSMHSLNAGDTIEVLVEHDGGAIGHNLTEASCTVQKIS